MIVCQAVHISPSRLYLRTHTLLWMTWHTLIDDMVARLERGQLAWGVRSLARAHKSVLDQSLLAYVLLTCSGAPRAMHLCVRWTLSSWWPSPRAMHVLMISSSSRRSQGASLLKAPAATPLARCARPASSCTHARTRSRTLAPCYAQTHTRRTANKDLSCVYAFAKDIRHV
eukprot:6172014-Pleurochrysis_carterae.AAC.1